MKIPDNFIISHQAVRKCFFLFRYLTTVYCREWPVITYTRDDLTEWAFVFASQKEYTEVPRQFYDYVLREKLVDPFVNDIYTRHRNILARWKQLGEVTNFDTESLWKYYNEAVDYFGRAVRAMMIIRFGDLVNLELVQRAVDNSNLVGILCAPTRMSFSLEEEIEFLETEDIAHHAAKWQWTSLGYFFEKPLTPADYLSRQAAVIHPRQKAERLKDEFAERIAQQTELMACLPQTTQWLVHTIQEAAAAKDFLKRVLTEFRFYAEPVFQEIGKRYGVESFYCTPTEIKEILAGQAPPPQDTIDKRHQLCITYPETSGTVIYYNVDALEIEKRYFVPTAQPMSELRGRIAESGFGKGPARILLPGDDLSSFREGEVLVTNNTTPNFVPIMKKAVAIVAEEGGLTSHTAVVSRELGIPCVIGVSSATKVLCTGDIIEVDANSGVVRKL